MGRRVVTPAEKAAKAKYLKKVLRVNFQVNPDTDGDIYEKLKGEKNKQGYLKKLVREDLKKQPD